MKWKVPLSVRFLVWLVLNLAMLAVVFGVVIRTEFRVDSLLAVAAGVDGVEGVGPEQVGEVVVAGDHGRTPSSAATPTAASSTRRRFSPARIRLFTVPSGSPRMAATSR